MAGNHKGRKQIGPFDQAVLDKAEQRLRSHIAENPATECWIAMCGGTGRNGGGSSMMMSDRIYLTGQRWAWLIWRDGVIPSGRSVMHTCKVLRCVNPEHLYLSPDPNAPRPSPEEILRKMAESSRRRGKLNWDKVDEIRESDEQGVKLARQYAVSTSSISSVRLGKTWVPRYGEREQV